jgi:hypothetical protein
LSDFYVYVFFRPWDGSPCYVGKGRRHRWLEHERLGADHYNPHFANVLKKAGGKLPKVKAREGLTEEAALEVEVALIAAIGRQQNGGPLVNLTDGGDGTSGWRHSPEAKARIAEALTVREITDETREKLRIAATGKTGTKHSDEFKAKISRVHKGRVKSDAEREAIRRAKIGHVVSPETRAKISAALKARAA